MLAVAGWLADTIGDAIGLNWYLCWDAGLFGLRRRTEFEPLPLPQSSHPFSPGISATDAVTEEETAPELDLEAWRRRESQPILSAHLHHDWTCLDYHRAYLDGRLTPIQVTNQVLEAVEDSNAKGLHAIVQWDRQHVLSQAEASTERYRNREPWSVLDGVPVAIKDELDVLGLETNGGTSFINKGNPAQQDAAVVARLRAAGALLLGKSNMHEIGFDGIFVFPVVAVSATLCVVTTTNMHWGACRNPHSFAHVPGGSSGGSASAVAAGLCPIAVGCDGGGSIRIPASMCGVYGLKPTFGRVSGYGALPIADSVGHVGPIATSAVDLLIAYGIMAGKDPKDANTLQQPPVQIPKPLATPSLVLQGLRIGVYPPFFEHASAQVCRQSCAFLEELVSQGAQKVNVEIPYLEEARLAHLILFGSEVRSHMGVRYSARERKQFAPANRLQLAVMGQLEPMDYIQANRVRTYMLRAMEAVFESVDVFVTPTVACLPMQLKDSYLAFGNTKLNQTGAAMRFSFLGNLTGIPAVTVPIGYEDTLPIGFQFMAPWWQEQRLLELALISEHLFAAKRQKPSACHYDIPQALAS